MTFFQERNVSILLENHEFSNWKLFKFASLLFISKKCPWYLIYHTSVFHYIIRCSRCLMSLESQLGLPSECKTDHIIAIFFETLLVALKNDPRFWPALKNFRMYGANDIIANFLALKNDPRLSRLASALYIESCEAKWWVEYKFWSVVHIRDARFSHNLAKLTIQEVFFCYIWFKVQLILL